MIGNGYDGAVHLVIRYFDRIILTQSISITISNAIRNNDCNPGKPKDLLSTMSSNGKENINALDKIFKGYFIEKSSLNRSQ